MAERPGDRPEAPVVSLAEKRHQHVDDPLTAGRELVHVPTTEKAMAPDDDPRLGDVDEWGRSERMRGLVRKAFDPVYRHYFRAEWEGLEHIPTDGGALLVANHAGAVPSDAPVIMHGIETELERPVYGLADNFFRKIPVVGTMWSRAGGLPAHPDNAYRLLHEQGQLVLVFPEGVKGTSKTIGNRYKLARFGRGGFVEIAMRAGVPIIPIAVMGNEEANPILWRLPGAKMLGVPYLPVTPQSLVLGPLGTLVPLPAKFKLRVLPPVTFDVPPSQHRYSRTRIMDGSQEIQGKIQEALYEMAAERRNWWGG
ncbi:MAG: acyltransferase family protein [Candidatus Microthrix sp.]|jgi:1-acyl-sn-glycerol-3-phosphate acyltransferase|nr:acyltransferase family protein [Candidatus Microthrix sp.]MBP7596362.1 acyltransferase family protein [Candidatus Microthrix sp.]MBP9067425.1 acyltransferase family protein [Candidatus Microthrix sp.]